MAAAGWYRAPGGDVQRWWTGWMWGPDVAGLDDRPLYPPLARRFLPYTTAEVSDVTQVLELPVTADLAFAIQDAPADRRVASNRKGP